MITESQVLRLVATSTFEPFDMYDFDSFAGVTSGNPMICNTETYVLILDGSTISYIFEDEEENLEIDLDGGLSAINEQEQED